MKSRALRWGILGTANIARRAVIPAIQNSANGVVAAAASRDPAIAADFARSNGIPRSVGSYLDLVNDPGVDAVYNPLPNSLHHEWCVKAARAGKHILCEKPLGVTADECVDMHRVASECGVKLMEAFMYRFHPRTERVIELIRSDAIGPLQLVRSSFTFALRDRTNIRLSAALAGGALMDVGCYCVNVSRLLAGDEPTEVFASAELADTGVDEKLAGILRFPTGLLAPFDCALNVDRNEFYHAAGPKGYLDIRTAFLPGTGDVTVEVHSGRDDVILHDISGADEYRLMVEHFADCVLHDRVPRYSALDAAANMAVIDALYRSVTSGKMERVRPVTSQ